MALPKPKPSKAVQQKLKAEETAAYAKNKKRVIEHLKKRGLRDVAIAGIIGNIDVETGGTFDFQQRQTKSGDPRDPNITPGGAYGLFQFDDPASGAAGHETWYKQYLEKTDKTDSLESQLDYALDMINAGEDTKDPFYEFSSNIGSRNAGVIKGYFEVSDDPKQVSDSITDRFLKPGVKHSNKRRESAKNALEELKLLDKTDTFPPERVFDVPEEKSMFERVKPYIPVVRHLNEGGAIPMERQMEMFDEGGLSTDEDFKEDLEGTFEITPEMQERIDEMTKEERDALRKKLVADAMERMLSKSPEKIDRSKFIQQYDEGGLEQDGGTIDPISGNDVPPGSSQEEVRDDIPAQLSEGEFVFPADVVRYIGLEKLMQMRQEAKMGLKMMEEMGQMGNSDQATMPDDLPFDINDLDMDDEIDDNIQNFNVGGMPMPNPQTGVFYTPSTSGVATSPVQAASAQYQPNIAEPVRPQQAPVPIYQPREIPQYVPFIGGGAPNVEQETRQFINDEGNIINVIFNKATGEPLNEAEKAKITEGYRPYDPNAPKVEDTTVTPTQVQTATVTGEGGRSPEEQEAEEEARRRSKQRIQDSKNLFGLETMEGVLEGIGGTFGTYGPDSVGKMTGTGYIIGKNGQLLDPSTGLLVRGGDTGITSPFALISGITDPRYQNQKPFNADFMNALPDNVKGRFVDNLRNNPAYFSERFKNTTSIAEVRDSIQKADDFEKDFKDKGFVINSDGSFTARRGASKAEQDAAAAAVLAYAESMSEPDDDDDDDGTFNRLVRESMAAKARRERGMTRPLDKGAAERRAKAQRQQNILADQERRQESQLSAAPTTTEEVIRSQEGPGSGMAPQTRQDPGRDRGPGRESFGREGGMGGRFRAKGGLMETPKPKAKKKMKRGGLASKK